MIADDKFFAEIDQSVGLCLHRLRIAQGMSQADLGKENNVSFQQIQKYEKGRNSLSAPRLFFNANLFNVALDEFFLDVASKADGETSAQPIRHETYGREALVVYQLFNKIQSPEIREQIKRLLRSIAA